MDFIYKDSVVGNILQISLVYFKVAKPKKSGYFVFSVVGNILQISLVYFKVAKPKKSGYFVFYN